MATGYLLMILASRVASYSITPPAEQCERIPMMSPATRRDVVPAFRALSRCLSRDFNCAPHDLSYAAQMSLPSLTSDDKPERSSLRFLRIFACEAAAAIKRQK